MIENQPTEYGSGRGVERLPDRRQRPLADSERARIERTAAIRDQSLEKITLEGRRKLSQ